MPTHDRKAFQMVAILKGLIVCFIILISASLVLGLFFSITDKMEEDVANRILQVLNYIAIFGGGIYTARKARYKGWFNGGMVGLMYMGIVVFIGSQFAATTMALELLLRLFSGFLAGAVGGVFGVNLR